jgi:hypothetical protein
MQKYKLGNQANADGTAKDGTIKDPTSGTKITASFLNDNFFNLFSFVENAGYSLIDDDLSQLTKALKGRYVSTYTYNTSSITTQSVNDVVLGSDGKYYEVQNNNVTNDDPVGSTTGNWVLTSFDASPFGMGFNQTWQNVTSSRSSGVTYTNTTNKPIYVSIYGRYYSASDPRIGILYIDNVQVGKTGYSGSGNVLIAGATVSGVVPAGSTYMYTEISMQDFEWSELR